MELQTILALQRRTLLTIWFAMLVALGMYGLVGFQISAKGGTPALDPTVGAALMGAAGVTAIVSLTLWFVLRSPERLRVSPERSLASLFPEVPADLIARMGALPEEEQQIVRSVPAWRRAHVICWALNESVGLCGLVTALQAHDVRRIVPFLVAGVALQALMVPRMEPLVERLRFSRARAGPADRQ